MTPSKFLFAREFPSNGPRVAPIEQKEATLTISEHRTLLAAAVAGTRTEAFIQGRLEAEGEQNARLAEAVEHAAARLGELLTELDAIRAASAGEAIRFAHAFAVKLAGSLLDQAPMAQIETAARAIFDDLRGQPHVAIRVAPELADAAKQALGAIARERGYEGRLIVLGEPEIAPGDVRIEWADGGIVRDRARAETLLAQGVERALAVNAAS